MSPIIAEMKGSISTVEGSTTNAILKLGHETPPGHTSTSPPATTTIPDGGGGSEVQIQIPSSSTSEPLQLQLPTFGTLIPNRVFVGGISTHTTESELAALFSKFGSVRGTKIILDRAGISKGYGFVTFETEEEARRLFIAMHNRELPPIVHRDRRLNIAPAVKKQPILRQGDTSSLYGSASASTTLSPPPSLEPFYFPPSSSGGCGSGGGSGSGTEFLMPPPPPMMSPDSYLYQQPNPFPFFNTTTNPNLGLGAAAALPGPNGSIIFLPLGLPFQQNQSLTSDPWNLNPNLSTFGLPHPHHQNHHHHLQSWTRMHSSAAASAAMGTPSANHQGASHHHHTHSQYLGDHHHHHHLVNSGQQHDPLLYFSNALISSPH